MNLGPDDVEFINIEGETTKYTGYVKKGTKIAHGIAKCVWKGGFNDGVIYEGIFINNKANGFGREI